MSTESYILHHDIFLQLIREQKLSHAAIAKHLKISTKTVQRWVNKSSKKIKKEQLKDLADLLQTDTTQLIQNKNRLRISPANKALEVLLSDPYMQKNHCDEDWRNYLKILKHFKNVDLPTHQALLLHKAVGRSFLNLGSLRAGKAYLKAAWDQLQLNKDHLLGENLSFELQIEMALTEYFQGDIEKTQQHLRKISSSFLSVPVFSLSKVRYQLLQGHLHYHQAKYKDAEELFRGALLYCFTHNKSCLIEVAQLYQALGLLYFKTGSLTKSFSSFRKMGTVSQKIEWRRGICTAQMLLKLSKNFHSNDISTFKSQWRYLPASRMHSLFEKAQLAQHVLEGKYDIADQLLKYRKEQAKFSPLLTAQINLETALLNRVSSGRFKPAIHLRDTENFLNKNDLFDLLDTLKLISAQETIQEQDFLRLYF